MGLPSFVSDLPLRRQGPSPTPAANSPSLPRHHSLSLPQKGGQGKRRLHGTTPFLPPHLPVPRPPSCRTPASSLCAASPRGATGSPVSRRGRRPLLDPPGPPQVDHPPLAKIFP